MFASSIDQSGEIARAKIAHELERHGFNETDIAPYLAALEYAHKVYAEVADTMRAVAETSQLFTVEFDSEPENEETN